MPRQLEWGDIGEVSVVDAGANLKGRFPLTKGKTMEFKEMLEAALETPVEGENEIEKSADSEEEKAALVAVLRFADACGVSKSLLDAFEQDDDEEEDVEKDIDDEDDNTESQEENEMDNVEKRFEALQKQLDDERLARQEVEKKLELAKDQREYELWLGKAEKSLQFVPGESVEDIAKGLHALAKVDAELAETQFNRLSEVSTLLAKSKAFEAVGTSGRNEVPEDERIAKRSKELEKEGLSPVDALTKAAIEAEKR
jgi:hypothetical protein